MTTTPTTTASTTPPLLDYRRALVDAAPSEFDRDLESERTRWIRKRFLWFCAINVCIQIGVFLAFANDIHVAPPLAKFFNVLDVILVVGGYSAAFVYVLRWRLALAALLRLGLYITAILPSISIVLTRIDVSLNRASWDFYGGNLEPGALWALMSPWSIFLWFTIACLLIPWTAREALRPAAVILLANALLVTGDLLFSIKDPVARILSIGHLAASPVSFLPGLLICWWRFSRFRKRFKLTFESSSFHRLQHELAGARRIHESTLPPPHLHVSGPLRLAYVYEPMRQIGGDILYVHPPDQSAAPRVSVVLIDVNGHGFGAALMANRVIGETQRLFAENPDAAPHQILTALNRYVRLTLARESVFATALCLRADSVSGTLEYANGGHPPAILRRADGSVTRLDPDTYLLGVHDGEDYCPDCQRCPFAPGDALLAYTDGATEARDPAGQMLTIAGLTHLFRQLDTTPPDRWPATLLHQVMSHRRAPADDDTLIVSLYRA